MATRKGLNKQTTKKKATKKKAIAKAKKKKVPAKATKSSAAKAPAAMRAASKLPTVAQSWARIDQWFAAHPVFQPKLRPGASERAIVEAEKKLGAQFPADYRESLKIHDGQSDGWNCHWLPGAERFGSLASLVECWTDDRAFFDASNDQGFDEDERVHVLFHHPKHIPIAGSQFWDYDRLLLDLAPGPKGAVGQVIHRMDIELIVTATSFAALLDRIAREVERKGRVSLRE